MNITLGELELVVDELADVLVGGRVQEFRQPSHTAIWFSVRRPGASHFVLAETRPGTARLHLSARRAATLNPPPAFVSKLRHDLTGACIDGIEMPWEDRVVVFLFSRGEELFRLVFEASGHHPNFFITQGDGAIVLALSPSSSHKRSLLPGTTYEPPVGGSTPETCRLSPADSPSMQLEALYDAAEVESAYETERTAALSAVGRAVKRVRRTVRKVEDDRKRALESAQSRRAGELLKASLHLARRGMESISVPDFYCEGGPVVDIPLEPALSPVENMEKLFARSRKGARAGPVIAARLKELSEQESRLVAHREAIEGADDLETLRHLINEAARDPALRSLARRMKAGTPGRRATVSVHRPYREFTSATGRTILVGRGGKDNHALTFQHASPHDVWLHVRGFPGSHVVLRLNRGQQPDSESLLDAAHLAVRYSKNPDSGYCEVMWTLRRNVRAVRKGAPGQVIVESDSTVSFSFDDERLRRLTS